MNFQVLFLFEGGIFPGSGPVRGATYWELQVVRTPAGHGQIALSQTIQQHGYKASVPQALADPGPLPQSLHSRERQNSSS